MIAWGLVAQSWLQVLMLDDYNTRLVVLATMVLGTAAGIVGSFTLLRKRALLGDALSHATLPGIGLAFLLAPLFQVDGKSLPVLMLGAAISGSVGMLSILVIRKATRLKEDAALGIVLSVFFGGGLAILGIAQQVPDGHAAGLESFIYGKTASIIAEDAWWILIAGTISVAVLFGLYKELRLLCFDDSYARSRGYRTGLLDFTLMATVVWVTIVGLQAVGLILMIALLVIPAAAARFWTRHMGSMTLWASVLGAFSCMLGSMISALAPKLPSGATIVATSSLLFGISMFIGRERGVLVHWWRRHHLQQRIDRRRALRGIYELWERRPEDQWVALNDLLALRSWSARRLEAELSRLYDDGLIRRRSTDVALTSLGQIEARRYTREHRLWEMYLITHADVATERVDQGAEHIEDCLEPVMIEELERLLDQSASSQLIPASPHGIELPGTMLGDKQPARTLVAEQPDRTTSASDVIGSTGKERL